jgi:DNA repair protein RecO (recombination protein O)
MAVHYRTQGLILEKNDLREADRLFAIYTEDFGKLKVLGKSVRKIKSKLRGGMELFYLSEVEFIQGKTFKTLTDAILIENFKNIRGDLKKLKIAYQIIGVSNQLIKGEERDLKIWELFSDIFNKLNNNWSLRFDYQSLIYYYFLWNLLSFLGYRPQLYQCIICQGKLNPANLYFSSKGGGLVCKTCSGKEKYSQRTNPDVVKILRIILKEDFTTLSRLKIDRIHEKLLKDISNDYLKQILNK